jgi:hypothetical protein
VSGFLKSFAVGFEAWSWSGSGSGSDSGLLGGFLWLWWLVLGDLRVRAVCGCCTWGAIWRRVW